MKLHPWRAALVCFLLGALATAWLSWNQAERNRAVVASRFEELSSETVERIRAQLHRMEYGLRGMRGIAAAQGTLPTLAQVQRYAQTRSLDQEFPGARGFGIIWRVPAEEAADFTTMMRADGRPEFAIKQLAPHEGDRAVIVYIEPEASNRQAVGLDIASESRRREAALRAIDTGKAQITAPITLVQASGQKKRGFLVLLPVYRAGAPDAPERGRGWSYTPIVIDEVLASLDASARLLWLDLADVGDRADGPFFSTPGPAPEGAGLPQRRTTIDIFGRQWEARMLATPEFVASMHLTPPSLFGFSGAVLSMLLGALAFLLSQRRVRAEVTQQERLRRAAIVESSEDAIVALTLEGQVTEWNRGAERLFGFRAVEAVGRPITALVLPPEREAEDADIRHRIVAGERVDAHEAMRRHKDGHLIDVSVSATPIHDAQGRCIGLAKIFRDIRPAKQLQRQLEEVNSALEGQVSERTLALSRALHDLRNVIDALPSLIGYWDPDLRNVMANKAYADWFGVEPATLKGKSLAELLGPELFERNRPLAEGALRGEPQSFSRSIPRPDGGLRHSLAHYLPDVVDGEVRGFYVLVHDVTELQEQRTALEAEKRDKAALLAALDAHSIVSMTDRTGTIISVNDRFCDISGYGREELLGQNHRLINSGTHARQFWLDMWRHIAEGKVWHSEVCNRAKNGSLYWVDSVVMPFFGEDGRIDKIVSLRTDITDRKRAEDELRHTLALLVSVLKSATQVSIIAVGREGGVSLFNRGAERLLGYTAEEVIGKVNAFHWHLPTELEARAQSLSERLGRRVPPGLALVAPEVLGEAFDCHYVRKDGELVPVTLSVTEIRDVEGASLGFIGVAYDISARVEHERELQLAVQAARSASEAKSQFLANMSHEIRTPLNAVIGLAHLLQRTPLNTEQAPYVQNIKVAGNALLSIINDVLDLSKIEAGEMTIEHVDFSLRDVCSSLQGVFAAQAQAKRLSLNLTPEPGIPDALRGDPTRLRQVLTNLLGNAIKFTESGSVVLHIWVLPKSDERCWLRFEVRDTGMGIAEDVLPQLFAPFAQADATTTRRFGGTGLGLSIVRQLAELMGGGVGVQSKIGEGSCFSVELPFERAEVAQLPSAAAPQQPDGPRLAGLRILLVDDSDINLQVAGRLLEIEGAQVLQARNGAEAVQQAQTAEPLDVVLMDVQMPVMDGLEATRRIRAIPAREGLPILALTAGNTDTEHRRARDAGLQEILSKPLDPERLVQAVRRAAGLLPLKLTSQHVQQAAQWPTIDGIDTDQVRRRLAGDTDLFISMLRRMLAVCDDALASPRATPTQMQELARLMHNIKGSSSTLGAIEIPVLATRVEEACLQADAEAVNAGMSRLDAAASALRRESSDLLAQRKVMDEPAPGNLPDAAELDGLRQLLALNDLRALETYKSMSARLRAAMSADAFERLEHEMAELQFEAALDELKEVVGRA
ncbi:PAS domain S-box protein [Roseateles asaccharophilus]|uniref:histidine kinase n=1 Tax=Roseateles asaccharophilus TaxID=582607 RepID=A0ABU2ACY8_9BURK|nr:PAS domain S-box protein [Roseateles asaccharophilus]MDR7334362.1 PAS domain S-box-containing protein [Roseateles asaccharophilus]